MIRVELWDNTGPDGARVMVDAWLGPDPEATGDRLEFAGHASAVSIVVLRLPDLPEAGDASKGG